MFLMIGYVIALGAIFGGFALEGGQLMALMQPYELLMIAGGALGTFFASTFPKSFKATLKAFPQALKGSKYTKSAYLELLSLLNELFTRIRQGGLMSVEGDVDDPQSSELFKKYPRILGDHHILEFITDYLRLMVGGNLGAFEMENLMDVDIETHHREQEIPIHALIRAADGMPAFGIVAAVMGVVHTMESVGIPPAELGILIAHALVGTFLGILLAYGFVGPLSTLLEQKHNEGTKLLQCVKVTLLSSLNGYAPQVAVEFGRKVLYSTERPTFLELEEHVKQSKSK